MIAFRNKERLCALRPLGKTLMLQTLHFADEIKKMEDAPKTSATVTSQEKKMANALIDAMSSKFEPKKFKDKYQPAFKKIIAAKLKGTTIKQTVMSEPTRATDLMATLQASLKNFSKEKGQAKGRRKSSAA